MTDLGFNSHSLTKFFMIAPEWQRFLTLKLENGKVKTDTLPMTYWGNQKNQYEAYNKDYTGIYQRKP